MGLAIRQATLQDAEVIIEFNCRLAEESEGKTLEPSLIAPGVRAALADENKALYFVAENDSRQVVGQMMVTYEWSDWRNGWLWWIQSVYVRPEARRQGVFRALYKHVLETGRQRPDVIGLRLYVDNHNLAAQQTYYQLGMHKTNYFVLEKYPLD